MARRPRQHLLISFLTAALLLSGIVSSTHVHAPASDGDAPSVASVCTCQFHQSSSSDSPQPSQDENDGDCIICKLLAQFHADQPQINAAQIRAELAGFVYCEPVSVSARSIRLFQGRAPPVV